MTAIDVKLNSVVYILQIFLHLAVLKKDVFLLSLWYNLDCKNTHMYIYHRQNLNPVLFKYPMGMFKYSSEVVPTQTLQLNTVKVCLYVFETHNLKLPSAEQEAILSSCKNKSSRFFFFFPSRLRWIWQTSKSSSVKFETLSLPAPTASN